MECHTLRRRISDERGNGAIAYVVVTGVFSVLVFQPSLIVAAVDRLSTMISLLVSQLAFAF